ncbi:MAG: hypothetical protein HY321_00605 [Armatimonadetes bacterium]|nr:hypothetical protein [Armatimonadota bacterium]
MSTGLGDVGDTMQTESYPERMSVDHVQVSRRREVAAEVAAVYRRFPQACGILAWGSTAAGGADSCSDVDIGVYSSGPIPTEDERRRALSGLADDPGSAGMGRFGDLQGCEKFSVRGLPVFVGWWLLDEERSNLQRKLSRLLDTLDDAKAENELGEIQRAIVLWDPQRLIAGLQGLIAGWFRTGAKADLIFERLNRAEYEIRQHLPRGLAIGDVVWAEESRRNALNELIRALYYLNDRFLRRLKGIDLEVEGFGSQPTKFIPRVRTIAVSDLRASLPLLRELVDDITRMADSLLKDRQPPNG